MKSSRDYWTLYASTTLSSLGDGIRLVALPLLAIGTSNSALDVSLIMVVAALPGLVLGPIVGALVDRSNRRAVLVWVNISRAATILVFALLVLLGRTELWHIYAVTAIMSILELFADGATFATIPAVVAADRLERANSIVASSRMLAQQVLGSPLAAALVAIAVSAPFFVEGGVFILAGVAALFISRLNTDVPSREIDSSDDWGNRYQRLAGEIRDGMRFIAHNRSLRWLVASRAYLNLCLLMGTALMVLFAKDDLGLTDREFAFLFTAAAIGSVIGGICVQTLVDRFGVAWTLSLSLVVIAGTRVGLGLATGPATAIGIFFISGAAVFVWTIASSSYLQRMAPDRMRGRLKATSDAISFGSAIIAALFGGLLAEWIGVRNVLLVGGCALVLLAALWLLGSFGLLPAIVRTPPDTESAEEKVDASTR